MLLNNLLELLTEYKTNNFENVNITGISYNSSNKRRNV